MIEVHVKFHQFFSKPNTTIGWIDQKITQLRRIGGTMHEQQEADHPVSVFGDPYPVVGRIVLLPEFMQPGSHITFEAYAVIIFLVVQPTMKMDDVADVSRAKIGVDLNIFQCYVLIHSTYY